jgi:hypothetical protein
LPRAGQQTFLVDGIWRDFKTVTLTRLLEWYAGASIFVGGRREVDAAMS